MRLKPTLLQKKLQKKIVTAIAIATATAVIWKQRNLKRIGRRRFRIMSRIAKLIDR